MNSQASSEPTELNSHIETEDAHCAKHGPYSAKVFRIPLGNDPIKSGCPTCSTESRAKKEAIDHEQRERERQYRIESLLRRSGIPARFAERTLDNYHAEAVGQQRALKIARRFVETFDEPSGRGASLVFAGKPGTGKTHIACGIARHLIEKGKPAVFMTVVQALRHVKDTYRKDSDKSEDEAIHDLLQPDLLVLDEVGAQLGSEHEKMLMFEIINERYQDCRSTILISNLNTDELSAFLGDRVMDRFRESGAVVAFDWTSHRGQRSVA